MALQVFAPPEELEPPEFMPWKTYDERIKEYGAKLKNWIMKNGKGKYRGKTIRFGVADGYASYYILSLSPLQLIHDPAYDGYHFPYIERLTAADVKEKADQQDAWLKAVEKNQAEWDKKKQEAKS